MACRIKLAVTVDIPGGHLASEGRVSNQVFDLGDQWSLPDIKELDQFRDSRQIFTDSKVRTKGTDQLRRIDFIVTALDAIEQGFPLAGETGLEVDHRGR